MAGLGANGKVYDATTTATLSGSATVSAAAGDALTLTGTPVARFADPNAGVAKPITVSGLTLAGADSANYSLVLPASLTANIDPAVLTYVAQPAVRNVGSPITGLTGTVTGFVANETLASATQGTAVFTTSAQVLATPGVYAVLGSGLTATNYRFVQAPGNLQALTIAAPTATNSTSLIADGNALSIPPVQPRPTLDEGGLVNLLGSRALNASGAPIGNFGPTLLEALSPDRLALLISGRDRFKEQLLADARMQLELNPNLANLNQCPSLDEAQQGKCLISEPLSIRAEQQRALLAAATARAQGQPQPAVPPQTPVGALPDIATTSLERLPPTGAGPAAPTPETNVARSAAPPAAPATPGPELLALARPTLPASRLPDIDPLQAQLDLLLANYRVKTAALPQIERKIAILVGVDRYADKSIPPLENAVRDVNAVAKVLESRLGYEPIVLENATRATLVGALNRMALTMAPQDSVVVYYAGHGELIETTGQGYWLLSDSSATDPSTWLSNSDINRLVGQINARQITLVSDSCYSGSLATADRIRAQSLAPNPQDVLSRKTVVVMTSGGNEPVSDEGRDGHSLFAWHLLNVLGKVDKWQPGGNIFERVRFEVARALPQRPQYSASRSGGSQPGGDYLYEYRQLAPSK